MIRLLSIAALAVFALLLSLLCRTALAAESRVVDGIAAVVNTDVITYSQVRSVSGPRERLLHSQFKGEELAKQIKVAREAALKDLIDRQLIPTASPLLQVSRELPRKPLGHIVERFAPIATDEGSSHFARDG